MEPIKIGRQMYINNKYNKNALGTIIQYADGVYGLEVKDSDGNIRIETALHHELSKQEKLFNGENFVKCPCCKSDKDILKYSFYNGLCICPDCGVAFMVADKYKNIWIDFYRR